jgi:hypothetical protein
VELSSPDPESEPPLEPVLPSLEAPLSDPELLPLVDEPPLPELLEPELLPTPASLPLLDPEEPPVLPPLAPLEPDPPPLLVAVLSVSPPSTPALFPPEDEQAAARRARVATVLNRCRDLSRTIPIEDAPRRGRHGPLVRHCNGGRGDRQAPTHRVATPAARHVGCLA